MTARSRYLLVASLALAALWFALPGFTGATFTGQTQNATSTVKAAIDWTPPTVAMDSLPAETSGKVAVAATASDAETGIASVAIQYAASGGSWTGICTSTSAPYSCSWATGDLSDGDYRLRATATDNAGYSTTSAIVSTHVDNSMHLVMVDPGGPLKGTVSLSARLVNSSYSINYLTLQYQESGGNWSSVPNCGEQTTELTCSFDTGSYSGTMSFRAVAYVGNNYRYLTTMFETVTGVVVDNAGPTVSMSDPGSTIKGTVTLSASASDAGTGVSSVVIQRAANGSSSWTTVCTKTSSPYACSLDTTTLTEGAKYDFRAVATDGIGNTSTSAVVTAQVTNAAVSVSLNNPGSWLKDTVNLSAAASANGGVKNVVFAWKTRSGSTWTTLCTDTSSPYTCSWNTTQRANGDYDLRAVVTSNSNVTATSAVVQVSLDNTALAAADIDGVNRYGGTSGRIESGDKIVYTYNGRVDPTTLSSGWDGSSKSVSVEFNDVYRWGQQYDGWQVAGVNLGAAGGTANIVSSNQQFTLSGTMVASTTGSGSSVATVVTVTLNQSPSYSQAPSVSGTNNTYGWSPSSLAENYAGTAASTSILVVSGRFF